MSKRPLSTTPASARESDGDGTSTKRVRWDPRSDDEEMRTATASDEFGGTGEDGSAASNNEKVRLFPYRHAVSLISRSRDSRIDLSCD